MPLRLEKYSRIVLEDLGGGSSPMNCRSVMSNLSFVIRRCDWWRVWLDVIAWDGIREFNSMVDGARSFPRWSWRWVHGVKLTRDGLASREGRFCGVWQV